MFTAEELETLLLWAEEHQGESPLADKLRTLNTNPIVASFEDWCATKGLTPSKCDETNLWIREAFEGGRAVFH